MSRSGGKAILALTALLLASQSGWPAKGRAAGLEVPLYPGARLMLELNLSVEDFLPMLQRAVAGFGKSEEEGKVEVAGKPFPPLAPEMVQEVVRAVSALKQVRLLISRTAASPEKVVGFYQGRLEKAGWKRILWAGEEGKSTTLLLSLPRLAGAFVVHCRARGGQTMVYAVRTRGMLDLGSLAEVAARYLKAVRKKGEEAKPDKAPLPEGKD